MCENTSTTTSEQSKSEEDKLGAVGALAQLVPRLERDDHLIVCGDNIFNSSLKGMLEYCQKKRRAALQHLLAIYFSAGYPEGLPCLNLLVNTKSRSSPSNFLTAPRSSS